MPPAARIQRANATELALDLPPPFRPLRLREVGDAFEYAVTHAASEGAGTLVYVGRFDLAEFALVLEPDEPLRMARRSLYAGMAALADAIAVLAPPETPVAIEWPDTILVNLGLVGGGRLAWPAGTDENQTPDWMVFGAMIRLVSLAEGEAGLRPLTSALAEEGFGELAAERLIEAFARHFMVAIDTWQEQGFAGVARTYLPYLASDGEKGVERQIAENGDLLVRRVGEADIQRRQIGPAFQNPAWFDPQTRGPRQ
ncbi:MAG: biotin/lipoate--protein ligase family protein [Pseudomonadota bacterium]|jgi:biotin-(acetyl-CoA carboxylase) ligase